MTDEHDLDTRSSAAVGDRLAELLGGPSAPLDDELAVHLVDGPLGMAIKHPLVVAPVYGLQLNGLYNEQLRTKRVAVEAALAAGDVERLVWLHERPWRAEVFAAHAHLLDDVGYWSLLARVWVDSENIVELRDVWDVLLRSSRPGRVAMMCDEERAALAALPAVVEVFQGHTDHRDDGWSWTTDRAVAEWFAHRFAQLEGGRAQLSSARVARSNIAAYLRSRGESEVLIAPECISERWTESLSD